ncbi:MAG: hypothetical protein ABEJ47_01770 [Halorhabdus sp.]
MAPDQKVRVLEAVLSHGHNVAMTGDGVPVINRHSITIILGFGLIYAAIGNTTNVA